MPKGIGYGLNALLRGAMPARRQPDAIQLQPPPGRHGDRTMAAFVQALMRNPRQLPMRWAVGAPFVAPETPKPRAKHRVKPDARTRAAERPYQQAANQMIANLSRKGQSRNQLAFLAERPMGG